jgi:hypothetical protein
MAAEHDRRLADAIASEGVAAVEPLDAPRAGGETVLVAVDEPGTDRAVVAAVDLESGRVTVHEPAVRLQLGADERRRAEEIAGADERVASFLAGRDGRPLTRLWLGTDAEDPHEPPNRCAIVFLRPTTAERRYCIVDLTERSVIRVVEPGD